MKTSGKILYLGAVVLVLIFGVMMGARYKLFMGLMQPPTTLEMQCKICDKEGLIYDVEVQVKDVYEEHFKEIETLTSHFLWLYFKNVDITNVTDDELKIFHHMCIGNEIIYLKITPVKESSLHSITISTKHYSKQINNGRDFEKDDER